MKQGSIDLWINQDAVQVAASAHESKLSHR